MVAPAGSEFIDLCRSQVFLLNQTLGATSTVIYLAERSQEQSTPTLVPFVGYPESELAWSTTGAMLSELDRGPLAEPLSGSVARLDRDEPHRSLADSSSPNPFDQVNQDSLAQGKTGSPSLASLASQRANDDLAGFVDGHQLVLPLAYEGVVLGVIVSRRDQQPWQQQEQQQAEAVAKTIAISYVLDQRNHWFQLQLRQRQLGQVNQSETFHDLLHQFRNPLTALRTFGKLLVKRLQPDDPNYTVAASIVRESERLQELAQYFDDAVVAADQDRQTTADSPTLGELKRLAAEDKAHNPQLPWPVELDQVSPSRQSPADDANHGLGHDLRLQPGTIDAILTPLLLTAESMAQDRTIQLISSLPPDLPPVWMDPGALREVLSNLIDNALKYSPAGSLVWVTAGLFQETPAQTLQGVAVGDTGVGIPAADQPRIFERYYRGSQAQGTIPGTGLGLAIASELIQGMGGQIDLCSPAALSQLVPPQVNPAISGPGTVLIVWLPQVDSTEG